MVFFCRNSVEEGCLRMKKHILLNSMLFAIQASLSVTFAVYILKLNVLPDSVNIICLICLGLAMISSAFLILGKTKNKANNMYNYCR